MKKEVKDKLSELIKEALDNCSKDNLGERMGLFYILGTISAKTLSEDEITKIRFLANIIFVESVEVRNYILSEVIYEQY